MKIAIAADHVTLDCAGFKFTQLQNGGTIQIFNRTGVTVKNCHNMGTGISSTLGIAIFNSNHIRIVDNTSTGFAPDTTAIKVFNSNKVSIVGNVVTSSRGMQLFGVSDSFIEGNTITSSDLGMDIISSHDKREGNRSC